MSEIIPIIIKSFQTGLAEGVHLAAVCVGNAVAHVWSAYHTRVVWLGVFILFCKFLEKGIGSVLYNMVFFSVLSIIILSCGWDIIFNEFFDLVMFVNYKFSYWLVGLILQSIKRRAY